MRTDLIVVGAGPAGLAAAAAATAEGLSTVVVDERRRAGGSVNGALGVSARDPDGAWLMPPLAPSPADLQGVDRLHAAAADATFVFDALAWGLFPGFRLAVSRAGRGTEPIDADAVILATGSYVARSPFPGHELDGVVTPLGLVRALDEGLVAPDERVAVWGDDDVAEAVLERLQAAGVHGVAWLTDRPRPAAGTVHVLGAAPRAEGDARVRRIALTLVDGATATIAADWLVVAGPRQVAGELAGLIGCEFRFDGYDLGFRPVGARDGSTNVAGVFVAGSAAGAQDAAATEASGRIAGLAAAVRAGRAPAARLEELLAAAAPPRPIVPARIPPVYRDLDPASAAPACACTGATCAEVTAAIRAGARSVDDVKRQAKAGMGPCQGRGCQKAVVRLLDLVGGIDVATLRPMRARPPVRPVTARAMFEGEVPA